MINLFNNFVHKLAHFFKLNGGRVITFDEDGFIYVAFQCDCGEICPNSIDKIEREIVYGK